ncbi:MAG: hypothetical protein KKG59_07485 [Nanoarchaeota archaeon]|nr:hypothetical protein [Nanoarchaeota archaeon]
MKEQFTSIGDKDLFLQEELKFKNNNPTIDVKKEGEKLKFFITGKSRKDIDKAKHSISNIQKIFSKIKKLK